MFDGVPNVSKLAVFKDEEVVFFGQSLQFVADGHCVVLVAGKPTRQPSDGNRSEGKKDLANLQDVYMGLQQADAWAQAGGQLEQLLARRHIS